MKASKRCPKCGSTDIIADAKAIDCSGEYNVEYNLTVATFRKPNALVFKGEQKSSLSAWICATCGYVEFYANHPETLKTDSTDKGVS